ncbi:MAG: hypothetical protein K2H20_00045, partial [Bacilli bacterium]|nr:hypothetical protein [Bacilli bacterium]
YNADYNNNVYFANSCWKIIRTTETGGVKILYNGIPSNGTSCENPDISNIPNSSFNENSNSFADIGYMYNERYLPTKTEVGHEFYKITYNYTGSNYHYFSDSYRKENGKYYLENKDGSAVEEKDWSTDSESLSGYFTCHYPSTTSCTELAYITDTERHFAYIILLKNNEDLDDVIKI